MHKVRYSLLLLLVALVVVACGRNREATTTETPAPTNTSAPAAAPEDADDAAAEDASDQPESPLDQPQSPLPSAAESPLPTPVPAEEESQQSSASPPSEYDFLSDFDAITALAEERVPGSPEPGAASLSGILYSYGTGTVVPGTYFYLTPAVETEDGPRPPALYVGTDEESGDIVGTTGDDGEIDLNNIPPGNYYLVVWTVYNWLLAEGEEGADTPLLITVEEDEQLDLDVVFVNWP